MKQKLQVKFLWKFWFNTMVFVNWCKRAHLTKCEACPAPANNKTEENTEDTDESSQIFTGLSQKLLWDLY